MQSFWAQPLRRQLVLAIVLLLVPILVAAVWSGVAAFNERRQELGDQARIIAGTTAAYISRDIRGLDTLVARIVDEPAFTEPDGPVASEMLAHVLRQRPRLLRIALADPHGRVLAAAGAEGAMAADTAWAARAVAAGERIITPMARDQAERANYFVVAYPVADRSHHLASALGIFISLTSLEDAFGALPVSELSVTIADADGHILIRNDDQRQQDAGRLLYELQRERPGPLPTGERVGHDGVKRVYAESAVDAGPWVVSVGIPAKLAVARAQSLWWRSSAILVLGVVGWLAIALALTRRLLSAVGHLDQQAQRIASGDFSPMPIRPMQSREFADLQAAFDAMLTRFNDTRRTLDAQMAEERRIREELQSLQGQVIRQERLAAVGQLVSGVAHEINNPLQAILGFSELLQMQPDLPEPAKTDLRLIQKESARACGIIRNLAMFARQTPGEAAPILLSDVITSVAELRQRRLESEDIELRIEGGSTQHVLAVFTELQQVVLNFVVNAEQSIVMSGRLPGRITIRTCDRQGMTILEVEDTGPGIAAENEAKLFQPFFTTKPVGQGTGLGLSVSYGIIDSLGGRIGYRRAPAGGAIFYFELPATSAE